MKKPILAVSSISKAFNNQQALDHVSLEIFPGEIVGLVGANGAGKSTLLKIISGSLSPDNGSLYFNGEKLEINSPRLAMEKGIISVYQDLNLFSNLTVAENLFIDKEHLTKIGTIDWGATKKAAQEILTRNNLDIRADTLISNLSFAKQCMLDITRALNEKPRLLLLDEPTSALCESEIEWLYGKMKDAVKENIAIVFVSHRLEEINEICDRSVILKEGKIVHISDGKVDKSTTIKYMVGHDVILTKKKSADIKQEIALEFFDLESENGVKTNHLSVRKGEILGIAGLVGSGRTELLNSLFGIDRLINCTIKKDGKEITIKNPFEAIKNGIILIPEDRKLSGLFLEESMRFNIASSTYDHRTKFGMVDEREEKNQTAKIADQVMLDTNRLEHLVRQLSGGNQQKVVIARTLLANANVYLLDEPTRGVDIGAREEIYDVIKEMAKAGKSIILVTSDWEELIYLCDRMLVMSEMEVIGELDNSFSQAAIMHEIEDSLKQKESCDEKREGFFQKIFNRFSGLQNINFFVLFLLLVVLSTIGAWFSPFFLKWVNISNLFSQALPLVILSLGQLIVIMSGGIDISTGALLAGSALVGQALMVNYNLPVIVGISAIIFYSGFIGFVNGLIIQKVKVDAFIVTIGMMLIQEGIALVISPRPLGPSPSFFIKVFNGNLLGLPIALVIMVFLIAVFTFMIRYTKLGRRFFAIGENAQKSFYAGINLNRTKYISYILCSLMSGVAAIYVLGRFGGADPVLGPGMELSAIAAVLIGGATLAGGKGSVAGTVSGVFVLGILANIFSLISVDVWYQHVLQGVVLIIIIAAYERAARKKEGVV